MDEGRKLCSHVYTLPPTPTTDFFQSHMVRMANPNAECRQLIETYQKYFRSTRSINNSLPMLGMICWGGARNQEAAGATLHPAQTIELTCSKHAGDRY
jgi:hypothetical protein